MKTATIVLKIYLAGPDIFYPGAEDVLEHKERLTRVYGFVPLSPSSNNAPGLSPRAICLGNYQAIERCDAVIANVTPFQGMHADPGTCVEIGIAAALGKHIWAYTNDARDLLTRGREQYRVSPGIRFSRRPAHPIPEKYDPVWFDPVGNEVEDFGLPDNLMVTEAVYLRGAYPVFRNTDAGDPLAGFRECLMRARYILLNDTSAPVMP